jgi:glutathione S-transferase
VILDYLARETGHFEGRTEQQRWQAREWLSWEADHITYVAKVRHSARFRASHPETIAEFRPRAEAALSFVDKTVKDQPFLVGDYCTIADIGDAWYSCQRAGSKSPSGLISKLGPGASRLCQVSRFLMI